MTNTALCTPKDYALYYRNQLGFSVFIVKSDPPADRKKPVLEWKAYQNRLPSSEDIEGWFRFNNGNYNVAIVTGNISQAIAFDIDGKGKERLEEKIPGMSTNLRVAIRNTMVNKTGSGGLHIIFKIDYPIDLGQKVLWKDNASEDSEIRLKGNGGYIVMPPSIHENGKRYEWNEKEPHLITTQELNELIRLLSPLPPHNKTEFNLVRTTNTNSLEAPTTNDRTLSNDKMQELLYWVKPYYNPGSRNDIIFYLSGMMRIHGLSHETTGAFVDLLCNTSGYPDEDQYKSLNLVDSTYEKPLNQVKGKSGLHDILVTSHSETSSTEEYLARGDAFARICQILNAPLSPPTTNTNSNNFSSQEEEEKHQQQLEETAKETKVRELAKTLEQKYQFVAIEDTEELYYYSEEKGKYEPAEPLVKTELELIRPGIITDTVTNVIQKLARRHLVKRDAFDANLYVWNMANGLYDIRTNTLREHDWRYLSRKQIPVRFDPKARSKKFGKYLYEVVYPAQIRTVVEAMAYTFLRDNPFEIYNILVGFGSNGKSVLMHVLTKLHGEDNVSNTPLANLLNNRFAKKELEGKNVNIDMEMSRATIDDMSVLKELTGSQPIRIEPKYLQAYTTRLWAKHFFSTNEMPEMKDYTDAHYRREVIVSFPNQFEEGKNANPNLKHELTTDEELSGIFNALMIPLRRIIMEQKPPYIDAKTIQERRLKHHLITDPVKAFLEIATEPTDYESEPDITKEELYKAYQKFCTFYKLPFQKYDPFCKTVKARSVRDGRETGTGERKRIWIGIRLKKYLFQDTLTV
jgi:P4 family phage/plasmid primase-like protien